MKTTAKATLCCAIALLVGMLSSFQPGEAEAGWRKRCRRPSSCACATTAIPAVRNAVSNFDLSDSAICPKYIYMTHATYYSYYSQIYHNCQPCSYDSATDDLRVGTCDVMMNHGGGAGCFDLVRVRPGVLGYSGPRVVKYTNSDIPGPGPELTVRPERSFVIKFPNRGSADIYAQIFIARVTINNPNPDNGDPLGEIRVARGTEIDPTNVTLGANDIDYTGMSNIPFTTVTGHPHEAHYQYDGLDIQVITNHQTPPYQR